jgi:hypothetical protein
MKTIYLIEVNNGGHREAFMQLFARSLLESGHRVVSVMPDTDIVENWINQHCRPYRHQISFHRVDYYFRALHYNNGWTKVLAYVQLWNYYKKKIRMIEKNTGHGPDLVFFNCIDGFITNYLPHQLIDLVFPYRWSGLYFQPNHLRLTSAADENTSGLSDIDYALLSKNCDSVAIHDEGVLDKFSRRLNGKRVVLLPEIADFTPPDPENLMAKEIREKANGRIVIGMIGLEPYKGSYEFMRLAKLADPNLFFFAFCGKFDDLYYQYFNSAAESEEFREFTARPPEHCYWRKGILAEGAEYNAVFNSFDVMFLYYRNFFGTSNRLTKAAYFHKLVISNYTNCIGEDVIRYNLGETVPENQPAAFLAALDRIRDRVINKRLPVAEWDAFVEKNSEEMLRVKWDEILGCI